MQTSIFGANAVPRKPMTYRTPDVTRAVRHVNLSTSTVDRGPTEKHSCQTNIYEHLKTFIKSFKRLMIFKPFRQPRMLFKTLTEEHSLLSQSKISIIIWDSEGIVSRVNI